MNRVLVTGGSGSFGHAFIRRLMMTTDCTAIVYSRDEQKQETMARDFTVYAERLRFFIGDVRDVRRLTTACHRVDTIVHAAALKIIPALEYNPTEAVKTNVLGAMNVVDAALANGTATVCALSSDKATQPVNLYGATKLVAEKVFSAANDYGGRSTRFIGTRYGNVAGSRGSVIPVWAAALARGEPIRVTDPEMTRFWMTLDEAVQLVLDTIAGAKPGEVWVPELPAYRLGDLAEAMAPGAPIEAIGIRPGEKRHESMIGLDESAFAAERPGGYRLLPPGSPAVNGGAWELRSDLVRRMMVAELADRLTPVMSA